MKVNVIRNLATHQTYQNLKRAEEAIENGLAPEIEIPGEDEGEQLTHAIAAAWVRNEMDANGTDLMDAIRTYTQKVRNSIG